MNDSTMKYVKLFVMPSGEKKSQQHSTQAAA